MFAFVCLRCMGHCHLVFDYEFLAFLYLVFRLLYSGFAGVFAYIFTGEFPAFLGQKTSHSLLLSESVQRAFGLLS